MINTPDLQPPKHEAHGKLSLRSENLVYGTAEIEHYFSQNRTRWAQFYESERRVIDKVWPNGDPAILDIGCGCGGLGLALKERFGASRYVGIEINEKAATTARRLNPAAKIITGDFLHLIGDVVTRESYDVVFSLSCIDWNMTFQTMLEMAWSAVKPGGIFLASFRLTAEVGIDDISTSFQYINYQGKREGEIAPYVVMNANALMRNFLTLDGLQRIFGYGYFGAPSITAVTPYSQLCFAVMALHKTDGNVSTDGVDAELLLPDELLGSMREIVFKGHA